MHKENTAIILCGGKGTRLGKNSIKSNKTLLKYKGKPLIHHIIYFLLKNNINKIIIPYGYKGKDVDNYIKKHFKSNKSIISFNAGVNTSREERLKKASKFINNNCKKIIILNGDSFYKFKLNKIINKFKKNTVNLICTKITLRFGFIIQNTLNNKIKFKYGNTSFRHFSNNSKNINYFYSGLSIIDTKFFFKNISYFKNSFEDYLFNKAAQKKQLGFIFDNNLFFQVNTQEDLKNYIDGK